MRGLCGATPRICTVRAYYIQHLYDLFEDFAGTPPRVQNIRGGGARDRQCIRFKTYSHLWSPSGCARAQAPLVTFGLHRATPERKRLWSAFALWAPSGLGLRPPLVWVLRPLVWVLRPLVYLSSNFMLPFGQPAHSDKGRKKRVPQNIH